MKTTQPQKIFIILLAIGFLVPVSRGQQNRWADYEPRTLQSVIDSHRGGVHRLDYLLSAHSFPSQVKLVYLGKTRQVMGKRKELLRQWVKMVQQPGSVVELFQTEVLFREGTMEHWLLVQKPLIAALRKEVKAGESINSYVIFMGGAKQEGRWEWMFAMNEFDAPAQKAALH